MNKAIYDIDKKYETLGGKLVEICYFFVGILAVPVGYGVVLWCMVFN